MRVVVFGGGYAGVAVARRLEGALDDEVDLVVVDDTGTHLVQHELHRIVRRPSLAEVLELPLADLLDDASTVEGRVADVDPDAGDATLEDGETLSYDAGALCLGAETAFHGLETVREQATPLKRVTDALAIRESFIDVCASSGHAIVGGAGLSGVQVAGELSALAEELNADPRITLLEQEARVAPSFPPSFGAAVRRSLEAAGVTVRTGSRVAGADEETVELATGDGIDHDQLVWTGGIRGSAAVGGQRPTVRADLRLGERTLGVGDAVRVVDANGEAVPASAQAAVRQAETAARNLQLLVDGGDGVFEPRLERFTFDSPGWLVSVGNDAVAMLGPTVLTGTAARAMKATIGANYFTSVGAVRKASDLVYEELGLGDPEPSVDVESPDRPEDGLDRSGSEPDRDAGEPSESDAGETRDDASGDATGDGTA